MDYKIEIVNIDDIQPNESNTRQHTDIDINNLIKSIQRFGFRNPIICNKEGIILCGNGRYQACKKMGITEVPVHYTDMSEEDAKAFAIMDNRSAELSTWNLEYLMPQLESLKIDNMLDFTGFTDLDIKNLTKELQISLNSQLEATEDDFDESEVSENKYNVKNGDIYLLGNHRLMCGDSTNKEDVDVLMDGKNADLLLTDPPYGINIVNSGNVGISANVGFGKVGTKGIVNAKQYKEIIGDDKPFDPEMLLRYGDTKIIFGANNFSSKLPDNAQWIVWDKKCEKGADHNNFSDCELAWTNVKAKSVRIYRHLWSGLLREGNRETELKDRVHPTQKPAGLLGEIIKDFSKEGDIVLDLFLGSGSTLIACEQLNRICYGMELDEHYCSVIIERYHKLKPEEKIYRIRIGIKEELDLDAQQRD